MKTASAKAKGRRASTELKDAIVNFFPELTAGDVYVTPSGVNGCDLVLSPKAQSIFPFAVEVKNQEHLNIWSSLKQAHKNTKDHQMPLLAFRRNRDEMHIALRLVDFLTVLRGVGLGNL